MLNSSEENEVYALELGLKRKEKKTSKYISMQEFKKEDYLQFAEKHNYVVIEDTKIPLRRIWKIETFTPPKDYVSERETTWSFPDRGSWATHIGDYRGNWSPYIPRNLILKYTEEGDTVLDQMVGSGTTLVECKLLGRNGIGIDINPNALIVTYDRLNFEYRSQTGKCREPKIKVYLGDARNLDKINDDSIDLVATHPPYAHIVSYSKSRVEGDLSALPFEEYVQEMGVVAKEAYRVLKPGKHCAILIGDTRKHKHYVPIAFRIMQKFLEAGFILREDIIKQQWKMKSTREKWRKMEYDFYLITHEHLFVFRKPLRKEDLKKFKLSSAWW
ncbi:MAG: DNA methyltransferase [Thermoproteota archaeon]